ncbi:hypothetical protein, partial [Enterocloster clostridioformis]|uniref:hypothetical protein n=1 Tax=Enterocloster clostridioformis TaxID=1531 RepID=UPI001A9AC248
RTTFTGQWFASGFLQTPPHDDALAIGCTLPTAGRVRDFHPLERAPAGRTQKEIPCTGIHGISLCVQMDILNFLLKYSTPNQA